MHNISKQAETYPETTGPMSPAYTCEKQPPTATLNYGNDSFFPQHMISPTFSLLWSDPSSALCPGSFAGWQGCRPIWILDRFWCTGRALRRTVRSQRCQGSPAPRARSPPRSPCGKNPLWWGRTFQWTSRSQTAQWGRISRPHRCPGPPLYTRASWDLNQVVRYQSPRVIEINAKCSSANHAHHSCPILNGLSITQSCSLLLSYGRAQRLGTPRWISL